MSSLHSSRHHTYARGRSSSHTTLRNSASSSVDIFISSLSVALSGGVVPCWEHCKTASTKREKSKDTYVQTQKARTELSEPLWDGCASYAGPTRRMPMSPRSAAAIPGTRAATSRANFRCRRRSLRPSMSSSSSGSSEGLFHLASQIASAVIGHPSSQDASTRLVSAKSPCASAVSRGLRKVK